VAAKLKSILNYHASELFLNSIDYLQSYNVLRLIFHENYEIHAYLRSIWRINYGLRIGSDIYACPKYLLFGKQVFFPTSKKVG
jgi:hypothetical protein